MNRLDETRHSLLLRLSSCQGEAWDEFVEIYEQAILRYSRSRGLQFSDAEDAVQEVFLAVHKYFNDKQPKLTKGRFSAWLFCVARNIAVDHVRRKQRDPVVGNEAMDWNELQQTTFSQENENAIFHQECQKSIFKWAANRVRPEVRDATWQAFWLTTVEGATAKQAADATKLSIGAVYTAKCRVMTKIKAMAESVSWETLKDSEIMRVD